MDGREPNTATVLIHVGFVALCYYNMYYSTTDANRPEKDQFSVKNICDTFTPQIMGASVV